ncbi:dihydroneopterin aldolase [Arachidicoccus ginsenosidimutans]|uniref:dihydroneopterin aldolase n=1 Tax=Arachidicoccus sp. BS20 TaxID=1850526 RepID=UPI0007F15320|nr:dihydroneopterin aldolase [Arachidicoccus sp. BS20]ANI90392.1 dihydroneopterin aldolase [Arachidicoccus sp. BS20]
MLKIELHNLWFHANHGLYEEEKVLGGDFMLDVEILYKPKATPHHISETVDYSAVYSLIKSHMAKPEPLLETLAMNITNDILHKFQLAEEVSLSIKKINPPMIGFTGNVSVTYTAKREQ